MPSLQYDKHSLHCVLGSVSNNSNNSTLPTSWINFLDVVLNGLYALFCCRSRWRECRWGWFSIFLTNSRTRELSACFKTECGCPRIRRSRCAPRSALFAHDLNRHGWQRVAPISHEVFRLQRWVSCFHDKNVFRNHLAHFLCFDDGLPRSVMCQCNVQTLTVIRWTCFGFAGFDNGLHRFEETVSSWKEFTSISWERDVFFLVGFSCELRQRVAPICHDLGLELVVSIGNFWNVAQLVFLVVEHVQKPIPFSSRVSRRSLMEVACILFRIWLLQFPSWQLSEYNKLVVFPREWSSSIESDWTLILSSDQGWGRPNIPRSDVSSILCACIVHDAFHSSRSHQDPYDSCPWNSQGERTLSVCRSNCNLQVSIPNWWWNVHWLHIRHDKCMGRSCSELPHCPVLKDQ